MVVVEAPRRLEEDKIYTPFIAPNTPIYAADPDLAESDAAFDAILTQLPDDIWLNVAVSSAGLRRRYCRCFVREVIGQIKDSERLLFYNIDEKQLGPIRLKRGTSLFVARKLIVRRQTLLMMPENIIK